MWLGIGPNGQLEWRWNWAFMFCKRQRISWLSERLGAICSALNVFRWNGTIPFIFQHFRLNTCDFPAGKILSYHKNWSSLVDVGLVVATPCGREGAYWRFGGAYWNINVSPKRWYPPRSQRHFYPEDKHQLLHCHESPTSQKAFIFIVRNSARKGWTRSSLNIAIC